jgi:hypothetical protein
MESFLVNGREVKVNRYDGKVTCSFEAQNTSWACQGEWSWDSVTFFEGDEFTVEKATERIKKGMDVRYYAW